ncbi:hypothetical protein AAE478_005018 [Parahypoxylon ruwenzoriense]
MASSEVDQKFLGRLAKAVEPNNALLASMLFKILGLSINVAGQLVRARKHRRLRAENSNAADDDTVTTRGSVAGSESLVELYFHILWLSREGLVMLEQYVLPMVGDYVELKVLAYKLRASFYHVFVQFHNNPPVSPLGIAATMAAAAAAGAPTAAMPQTPTTPRPDKGKGVARDGNDDSMFVQPEQYRPLFVPPGGPAPPPGFPVQVPQAPPAGAAAAFLLPSVDYLPTAHQYFREACALADSLLWGSHSLRLSVRTEYAAFLYECVHDREGSRRLAKETIAEVYEASEGMDDDMFNDACELVTVLGKMMKRGLGSEGRGGTGSNTNLRSGGGGGGSRHESPVAAAAAALGLSLGSGTNAATTMVPLPVSIPPVVMENPI